MLPEVILCDIEGTTTSISFVHDVLFPLASDELESFIGKEFHAGSIKDELEVLSSEFKVQSEKEIIELLQGFIKEDKKHAALKSIQGKIWRGAYLDGRITGHMYPEVKEAFELWQSKNIKMAIYSSGSVEAQKLIFGYSDHGDLTPFLSAYFDTRVGHKRDKAAYDAIAKELSVEPSKILFLSDVPEELDAASDAGYQTKQLVRPGNTAEYSEKHHPVNTLLEVL